MYSTILVILFFSLMPLHASDGLMEFCEKAITIKAEAGPNKLSALTIYKEYAKLTFKLSSFGEPVQVKSEELAKTEDKGTAKNVLFIIGSPKSLKEPEKLASEIEELKNIHKKRSQINRMLAKAFKSDASSCVEYLTKKGFSLDEYRQLIQKQASMNDAKLGLEEMNLFKKIKAKNADKNWEVRRVFHVEDLIEVLNSGETLNMAIITHSADNGLIIDSYGNGIPKSLFSQVSSHVKTLAIYSCHGNSVKEFYHLDGPDAGADDVFVAKESSLLGKEGIAPLMAAPHFVNKVMDHIDSNGVLCEDSAITQKECRITISGIKPQGADFGVFLNTKLIGVIKDGSSDEEIELDCKDVNLATDQIGIRNLSVISKDNTLTLEEPKVSLTLHEEIIPGTLLMSSNNKEEVRVIKAKFQN